MYCTWNKSSPIKYVGKLPHTQFQCIKFTNERHIFDLIICHIIMNHSPTHLPPTTPNLRKAYLSPPPTLPSCNTPDTSAEATKLHRNTNQETAPQRKLQCAKAYAYRTGNKNTTNESSTGQQNRAALTTHARITLTEQKFEIPHFHPETTYIQPLAPTMHTRVTHVPHKARSSETYHHSPTPFHNKNPLYILG
jgi:hypothetical protein